ncbi:hypothetical protein L1887_50623 [Cichorium endivia]|nr:hypothetical protein L1887_50623 [Cichorium endivia]
MAMEGTKIPAGTLHPYEMMTSAVRSTVASSSELTITPLCPALAKVIVIAAALALAEEDLERLGHIDAQELVGIPNEGREHRQHHPPRSRRAWQGSCVETTAPADCT